MQLDNSNNPINLGPESMARYRAIQKRLAQITGQSEGPKADIMLHLRPAIGKRLDRTTLQKRGMP